MSEIASIDRKYKTISYDFPFKGCREPLLKGKSASALSTPFLHQLRETSNRIEMWIYVSWRLSCIADSFVELLGGMGEYQTHILFIYLFPWNKATCSRESCWS